MCHKNMISFWWGFAHDTLTLKFLQTLTHKIQMDIDFTECICIWRSKCEFREKVDPQTSHE